jgi:hypothetical protein
MVRAISCSGIRAGRTRAQRAQDGGSFRIVELQEAPAERHNLFPAPRRPHDPIGPVTRADQQVPQFVYYRVTQQLIAAHAS